MKLTDQPISGVEWINRDQLQPNDYNPNKQPPPEHKLLIQSILENGWTQPIVVFDDGEQLTIVDGEHRWRASGTDELNAMTDGMVPIVRIKGDRSGLMMATIRHNRARGEHGILPMSSIVTELLTQGNTVEEIMKRLGMEREEVKRLAEKGGMPELVGRDGVEFSKGWVPR